METNRLKNNGMMDGRCSDTSQFRYIFEKGKKLVERESLE
jgi:hypothetical protein